LTILTDHVGGRRGRK